MNVFFLFKKQLYLKLKILLQSVRLALIDACLERMHYLEAVPRMAHAKNRSPQLSRGDEFPNGFSWGLNIL